jgi:hypothetical protein
MVLPFLLNNCWSSCSSISRICRVTAGWVMNSSSAALVKLRRRATAANTFSLKSVIILVGILSKNVWGKNAFFSWGGRIGGFSGLYLFWGMVLFLNSFSGCV